MHITETRSRSAVSFKTRTIRAFPQILRPQLGQFLCNAGIVSGHIRWSFGKSFCQRRCSRMLWISSFESACTANPPFSLFSAPPAALRPNSSFVNRRKDSSVSISFSSVILYTPTKVFRLPNSRTINHTLQPIVSFLSASLVSGFSSQRSSNCFGIRVPRFPRYTAGNPGNFVSSYALPRPIWRNFASCFTVITSGKLSIRLPWQIRHLLSSVPSRLPQDSHLDIGVHLLPVSFCRDNLPSVE